MDYAKLRLSALIDLYKSGDKEAGAALVEKKIPSITKLAESFGNTGVVTVDDLVQVGCLGLLKALDKFDRSKGENFNAYASFWIRREMQHELEENVRTIHVPLQVQNDIRKIAEYQEDCYGAADEIPTVRNIAEHFDFTEDYVRECIKLMDHTDPLNKHKEVLSDLGNDYIETTPEQLSRQGVLKDELIKAINKTLTPREAFVIRERYLNEDESLVPFEKIGKKIGLTRERVRQIEARALYKLRHYNKNLQFLGDSNGVPLEPDHSRKL